ADLGAPEAPAPPDPAQLAQLSRRKGWYRYAWGAHAFPTTVTAVFLGPYLTDIARNAAGGDNHYLHLAGLSIRAESFYPFAVTAAALLQAAILPLVGAAADRSGRTRGMLAGAMTLGVVASLLFYTVTGGAYLWGGALFLAASLGYSTANVLANGYLPTLAAPDERDAISSKGWAVGYLGGAALLTVNLVIYTAHSALGLSQSHAARVALASAGLWWLVFGTAGVRRLTAGTSQLPKAQRPESGTGYRQLGRTLAALSRNRNALLFLLAYMAYNEGVQTVISFASTYGTKQLDLGQSVMASAILVVQFVAFGGALWMGRLAARHGTRRTISGSLVVWIVLLAAAFTMTKHAAWQFYLLGCAIGLVLGGTQALSRSLFAQIIPAGQESEYFGLYEVSQNGVAWIGSLTVALAIQFTGSYRLAIISLVAFFALGLVLLARTDLRTAIRTAGNPVPERL
ncbi:MFS transporter, partial [Catenulispora sp. NF23]|uniref:MFS transporter n=1 Tax=Catenulispora pinistramenti TaxID=2705254 RepID=UPI001BA9C8CB